MHEHAYDHEHFRRIRSPVASQLVRLRALEEADLEGISQMFNDPDVLQFLDAVTFPQPLAGTRAWWEHTRTDPAAQTFAIETSDGELVGACSLEKVVARHRSALLGIWLGRRYWGKGYGTDAVRTLCRFAFREMNLHRITLEVYDFNERGRRAYERIGFKEEGRLRRSHFVGGRYADTIVMGVLAEELVDA